MKATLGAIDILYLLTAVLGLITVPILIGKRGGKFHRYNYLLGIYILFLSLGILTGFLINSKLIVEFPFIFRFGNLLALLCMPFSYLYVRSVIKGRNIQISDWWFFLPTLFYIIDYFPVLILPGGAKLELFKSVMEQGGSHLDFAEGWLSPPNFHLVFRHVVMTVFWIMQLRLLLSIQRSDDFIKDNKYWYFWIWAFQSHQVFYFVPFFLFMISPLTTGVIRYSEGFAIGSFLLLLLYLLYRPVILYGLSGILNQDSGEPQEKEKPEAAKYIPKSKIEQIKKKLTTLMDEKKPFLNPDYSLNAMAKDLEISPWLLSSVLNKSFGMNFNRYLNCHRIQHCLMLLDSGAHKANSLEGIARDCGFNNRNTFTQSFKQVKRITPSVYIRQNLAD